MEGVKIHKNGENPKPYWKNLPQEERAYVVKQLLHKITTGGLKNTEINI